VVDQPTSVLAFSSYILSILHSQGEQLSIKMTHVVSGMVSLGFLVAAMSSLSTFTVTYLF
jgi:hypothetical protein